MAESGFGIPVQKEERQREREREMGAGFKEPRRKPPSTRRGQRTPDATGATDAVGLKKNIRLFLYSLQEHFLETFDV